MLDVIILAGGLGTRLREVVPDLPKPLALINGVSFLDILLEQIEQSNVVKKVVLALGYKAHDIVEHFTKNPRKIELTFSFEEQPLGTGGAVKKAMALTDSPQVFVMNGDSYLSCSLKKMQENFQAPMTLAYTHVDNSSRFGWLEIDELGKIQAFREKQQCGQPGFINAGIYLFDRKVFDRAMPEVFSLEKELFPLLIKEGIAGFRTEGVFIDIGTPESYARSQDLLQSLTTK